MKIGNFQQAASSERASKWRIGISFLACSWLLAARPVVAADFQLSASLDRTQIALNEQCVLNVTVSGDVSQLPPLQFPNLTDFQIANAGTSQNFSWVNGRASSSMVYTFVLTPLKEGRFTIPSIQLTLNGQTATTQPLTLDVVKGNPAAIPQGNAGAGPAGNRVSERSPGEAALFIQGVVDKSSVYVGEPLTYFFRLYNRVPLLSQPRYQPPQMTGFWLEDLPPQRNYSTSVKGLPYNVTEVRTALFPSAPGKARVGSASLTVNIENIGSDPFSNNFFNQFFGRGEEKTLHTEPLNVHVKALPEPKPAGFKGAVGRFTLSASLDKDRVTVGQPLTLTWTVSGKGNIKALPDIPLPPLTNFRSFDANAATNIEKKNYEVQGSKVFKTVLIPTTSGDLTIPAVSFVFFDPEAGAYKTLRSQSLTVHVAAGNGSATPVTLPPSGTPAAGPGVQKLAEDIRYIKTPASIESQGKPLHQRGWFLILHALVLAGVGGLGLFRLYQKLFLSNSALARFRQALARGQASAKEAESALAASDVRRALESVSDGLRNYLADKLSAPPHGLTLKQILSDLKARGVTPHAVEKIRNLWETLDLLRFAPAQARPEEIRQTLDTFKHVIDEMEEAIQWK